jgi:hypothetical protein
MPGSATISRAGVLCSAGVEGLFDRFGVWGSDAPFADQIA